MDRASSIKDLKEIIQNLEALDERSLAVIYGALVMADVMQHTLKPAS